MTPSTLPRREFLRLMSLGALALGSGVASTATGGGARDPAELNILCWEGYDSDIVLDPFRAKTGARIDTRSFTNDPTMVHRLTLGGTRRWDLINVDNPWARKVMWPAGLIKPLDKTRFEPYFDAMLPRFKAPYLWATDASGHELLGMSQRFGPFSFVANTRRVSRAAAEDQGWDLWNDGKPAKYGVQESDDWNVIHLCCIAGLDPFHALSEEDFARFEATANRILKDALVVGDMARVNQALLKGEIDFYLSGGTYSVSTLRAGGASHLRGITPRRPVLKDGKAGISWVEITSVVNNPQVSPLAEQFLIYVQDPEIAHRVAFAEGTFNPVAQMGNPACLAQFTRTELDTLQWEDLEDDLARCAEYDIVPDYRRLLSIVNSAKHAQAEVR